MTDHELVVLSRPPEGVSDDAYNDWYDTHVREILALPGFVAAQRLTLEFVSATSDPAVRFTFLTRYEIEGAVRGRVARAARGGGRRSDDVRRPSANVIRPPSTAARSSCHASSNGPSIS